MVVPPDSGAEILDVRDTVRGIYRGLNGYVMPNGERRRIEQAHSNSTYGELTATSTLRLLQHLKPDHRDVFYDLGSGIGQVVLHTALATRVARSIGIELSPTRHAAAQVALERACAARLERARACSLQNRDFLRTGLQDATIVYTCSTTFPHALMRRLVEKLARGRVGLICATLQELEPSPWFAHTATLRLDTSWRRRTPVYMYRMIRSLDRS